MHRPEHGRHEDHEDPCVKRLQDRMDATTSRAKTQTVVFVRHGIAEHNIIQPDGTKPDLRDPNLFDPPLVRDGKFQALDAGDRLRMWWKMTQGGNQIELAIVSPLTRCLQTVSLAFLPGDEYSKSCKEPTIVCLEQIREAFGMHFPDRRRSKSCLASQWPAIHFDPEMTEEDEGWESDERESYKDVVQRVNQFLDKLVKRPETNIVVISHGVFIECCFYAHFPNALIGGDRVQNCDLFAAECISVDSVFTSLRNVRRIE